MEGETSAIPGQDARRIGPAGDEPVGFRDEYEAGPQTPPVARVSHGVVVNPLLQENPMTLSFSSRSGARPALSWLVLGAVAAFATTHLAHAAPAGEDRLRITVRYAPNTLGTPEGARAVYARLVQAAAVVCPAKSADRFVRTEVRECRRQAVERAVNDIASPQLAALDADLRHRG